MKKLKFKSKSILNRNSYNANNTTIALFSIVIGLVSITTISGAILSSANTNAASTSSDSSTVSVTVDTACTMAGGSSGTSTTGSSVFSANIEPGTTQEINGSKLVTLCNDTGGYSIYATGYSDNSYTTNNTKMISSLGTNHISTNTSGTDSWWAMKLASVSGVTPPSILNSFDNYHTVPASYTQIAKYTGSTATSTSAGAAVQAKYQVHIASAQPAATYTGKVKYTMVHPNGANAPTTPITLDAIVASGTTHYMQESINCAGSTVGTVATLRDNRDDQDYKVAKAADGQCWMIQNLKLGRTTTTMNLTSANSDVGSAGFTLNNKLSDGKFHAYTIDGVGGQNNSSEYYCTGDGTGTTAYESCYYNWYTATAGTGTTYTAAQGQNVDSSICPAGWTLPTQPQFSALYAQYNSAALMEVDNPTTTKENSAGKIPGFLLSGYHYTGGAGSLGSLGLYWSRTARSAQNGYNLWVNTSSVSPADNDVKYLGLAVRCLVRQ